MHPDLVRSRLLRPLAVLVAVLVTSVAVIGGCSGDEPESDPPSASEPDESTDSGSPTEAARPITTKTTVGRVIGKLGAKQKERLKSDVSALVDEFFDNAYLGDFPRSSFDKAYASFTEGARADAERDADLLSNTDIADRIDAATGTKRRVALDVMAVKGKPQGVTARFTLDFRTVGELERTERVKGYLLLADEGGGWRVFGYDVIRSVVA
ncbi:hypothetical protein GCM10027448_29830 [Nocardioides dilutus]